MSDTRHARPSPDQEFDRWSDTKSDLELSEILSQGDQEEINLAMEILHVRHDPRLRRFMHRKLPADWVDDALQDTWEAFFHRTRVEGIRKSVKGLLGKIGEGKRADTYRKLKRENEIEDQILSSPLVGSETAEPSTEEFLEREQEDAHTDREELLLRQIPYTSVLSNCERVIWVLRSALGFNYPSRVVAKLTGRTVHNIDQVHHRAKMKLKTYVGSDEYRMRLESLQMPGFFPGQPEMPFLVLERFTNPFTPNLNSEEIDPLGISLEEYKSGLAASLIVPWRYEEEQIKLPASDADELELHQPYDPYRRFYLLLSAREDWGRLKRAGEILHQLTRENEGANVLELETELYYRIPSELMVKANVVGERVVLTPISYVQVMPRPASLPISGPDKDAKTRKRGFDYTLRISNHSPRSMTPVRYFKHLAKIHDVLALPVASHIFNDNQLTKEPFKDWIQRQQGN